MASLFAIAGPTSPGVVNVPAVVEYAKTLPDVVFAENNLYTCSNDTQELIKEKIIEHNLNRVVVASCTPRTHEPLFRNTLRETGLNPYLFEMANIRDQCSWVHMHEPEKATEKVEGPGADGGCQSPPAGAADPALGEYQQIRAGHRRRNFGHDGCACAGRAGL